MVDQIERFRNRPIIFQREVFYGQLEYILKCTILAHSNLCTDSPRMALVSRCITGGCDATLEPVTYG